VKTPHISVVLPVYNGEAYLAEAVRSILGQTCTDFELLIVDDGSTDGSAAVAESFGDLRVRVIRLSPNGGIIAALKAGFAEARGVYIARMDADDLSLPERLARQAAFLDTHPSVGICGTWIEEFGARQSVVSLACEPEEIRVRLLFGWAMAHPTLMMSRRFLEKHGLAYREGFHHVEDMDLLMRASDLGSLANLPEVLLRYRTHEKQITARHQAEMGANTKKLLTRQLRLLVPSATLAEESLHLRLISGLTAGSIAWRDLPRLGLWLLRLRAANRKTKRYDRAVFERELRLKWRWILGQARHRLRRR